MSIHTSRAHMQREDAGPLAVLPLTAIRRAFEVNVFGARSVIHAFLPALRQSRGRIVQISTWTASVPLPFNGPSGRIEGRDGDARANGW